MLPTPGGEAPGWIRALMTLKPPLLPLPIVACLVIALVAHLGAHAVDLRRGAARGGRQRALGRAGRLVDAAGPRDDLRARRAASAVLSGMALVGLTTSADANIALRYTLLSIAGVILGGGEFVGGRVSPIGAVIGALTLTLAGVVPVVPAAQARLADRGAGGDPDPRAGAAAAADLARGGAGVTVLRGLAGRPWLWSWLGAFAVWLGIVAFTGGAGRRRRAERGADLRHLLRARGARADVRHHARARQRRPVDPGLHDARRHRGDEGDGRGERDDPAGLGLAVADRGRGRRGRTTG